MAERGLSSQPMMSKSRAKHIAPGAAAMVLFLMAFLGVRQERQRADSKPLESPTPAPISVEVGLERLARIQKFPAEIHPWIAAEIRSSISGRVMEIFVQPGAEVGKGHPLLRLDETRARIAMDTELTRHTEASRALVETGRLQKTGVVSEAAAEVALDDVRATRIRLDEERESLARHTIRSPISGILTTLNVQAGDTVSANQSLGAVSDIEKLRIFVHVPGTELDLFKPGEKLSLRLSPKGREILRPEILFVNQSADPQTGLFKIEAILHNKNRMVFANIQGTVEFELEVFPEGPVVPAAAVRFSENGTTVLREENGKAVPTAIRIGPEIDGWFPVFNGLRAGDRVFIGQSP